MKALELFNFLKEKGTWVNWNRTSDHFLFGNSNTEIEGVALGWMATFPNIKKAKELGCNLFITHEPIYLAGKNQFGIVVGGAVSDVSKIGVEGTFLDEDDIWLKKAEWLEENKMVVMRCHDVWDDFPDIGIHGAWAKWLGFNGKPVEGQKFYEVHDVSGKTLGDIVNQISEKVKSIGQECIHYIGDLTKPVTRIAVGTGAITNYRTMNYMDADVLVLTDDGTRLWESAQWSEDSEIPIIIVNHATAEEPGMLALAKYIKEQFPELKVESIKRGCLYKTK
jgi:putative NIF3 family GTP cyclohydrolase 1 type 2